MTEKDLYHKLKRALPHVHWTRIENTVVFGVPDINACWGGTEVWLELKAPKASTVILRPLQYQWMMKHHATGGLCAVVAAVRDTLQLYFPPFEWVTAGPSIRLVSPKFTLDLSRKDWSDCFLQYIFNHKG